MTVTSTRQPTMDFLGTDTFRGTGSSGFYRTRLYEKNIGETRIERSGLVRTDSPVSGNLLLSTTNHTHRVKDPIAGSTLQYSGNRAIMTAPCQKQQQHHSRTFYLTRDVDITIQTLRNTTKVSRYTNEKVGTAGTPTGLDRTLVNYQASTAAK